MVVWRTLLECLADGIKSSAKSSAAGLGCLVQRGSVLALRAILIRHGGVFSVAQWEAILRDTVLPALQFAAENETSPVVGITSESPHLSNIDFLADALPVPPPVDDPGLKKFEEIAMSNERSVHLPTRECRGAIYFPPSTPNVLFFALYAAPPNVRLAKLNLCWRLALLTCAMVVMEI